MADIDTNFDDIDVPYLDGDIEHVGLKVIEMADRLRVVDLACPGAVATWGFETDNIEYEVTVKVRKRKR